MRGYVRLLTLTLLLGAGCGHVAPHQRGDFARPSMDPATEADREAFEAHLRESREGSTYGASASGGGCGCN